MMTSAPCPEIDRTREAVRQHLSEEISSSSLPPLPRELKTHLASCAVCAAESRALDPTLLFVPLSSSVAAGPSSDEARRVVADVLAEVRRRSRVAPAAVAPRFLSRRFLQVAALVLLAAGLFGVEGVRLVRNGRSAGPLAADVTLSPSPGQALDAFEVRDVRSVRPLIQDLKNPGARVYEFAAVSPKEPSVVFIADPHADL